MGKFHKSKKFKIFALLVLFLALVWTIAIIAEPIRMPRFMVRNHVLRQTPMGMHMDDVIEVIEGNSNWRIAFISYESGFVLPTSGDRFNTTGDKSIRVWAGEYWPSSVPIMGLMMETAVSIFWGFDADGNLTDVYVWKSMK